MLEWLAWPGAIAILGIVFFVVFRSPITRLIDRCSGVKVGQTELSATPTTQNSGASAPPQADHLFREFDNALVLKYEANTRADLDSRNIPNPADREKLLIRRCTAFLICLAFEKTYLAIYGSQIAALQLLNTHGPGGADESEVLAQCFSPVQVQYPQVYNGVSFGQWIQFVLSRELVSKNRTRLVITLEGKEFLKYVIEQGYTLHKFY